MLMKGETLSSITVVTPDIHVWFNIRKLVNIFIKRTWV